MVRRSEVRRAELGLRLFAECFEGAREALTCMTCPSAQAVSYARLTEDRSELAKQLANRAAAHLMRGRPAEALLDCDEALAVLPPRLQCRTCHKPQRRASM